MNNLTFIEVINYLFYLMSLKSNFKILTFCFLIFSFYGFMPEGEQYFIVKFKQDSTEFKVRDNIVKIKKAPFVIQIEMKKINGVFLNASYNSDFFDKCEKLDCNIIGDVISKTMAESDFNSDKELMIDDSSFSYWFYDSSINWHRFDKDITCKNDVVFATKTISIFNLPVNKIISKIAESPEFLYLVFFSINENKDNHSKTISQKAKYKIKWKTTAKS